MHDDRRRQNGPEAKEPPTAMDDEDYYFEGPYMVFTEAFHRKRGCCCNSTCRHCPYREKSPDVPGAHSQASGGPAKLR
jgi:hypothetical protein